MHHTNDIECPLCNEKLKDAHLTLQDWFKSLRASDTTLHVSWSYRDEANQEQAFNDGKSKCHFPDSPHNKIPSLAIDLFIIEDGIAKWPYDKFKEIADHIKDSGNAIIWGGDFKSIGDADHYQISE